MNVTKDRQMCMGRLMQDWKSFNDRFYLFITTTFGKVLMIIFICLLLPCVATFLSVAYIFIPGTLEWRMNEISCQFQGLFSTDCNFQGLWIPWIFILKLKDIQRLSRSVQTLTIIETILWNYKGFPFPCTSPSSSLKKSVQQLVVALWFDGLFLTVE